MSPAKRSGRAFIGISGYDYPSWRGVFYPADLPRHDWLAFAGRAFDSVELNGTCYSLKTPDVFRRWDLLRQRRQGAGPARRPLPPRTRPRTAEAAGERGP